MPRFRVLLAILLLWIVDCGLWISPALLKTAFAQGKIAPAAPPAPKTKAAAGAGKSAPGFGANTGKQISKPLPAAPAHTPASKSSKKSIQSAVGKGQPSSTNPSPATGSSPPSTLNPQPSTEIWKWIWASDGARPIETVYFRQKFTLAAAPVSARLLITADDSYQAYFNGSAKPAAEANDWTTVREYDVTRLLKAGDNVLGISCRNTGGAGGLLYKLIFKTPMGRTVTLVSNGRVRALRNPPLAWNSLALDDKSWKTAAEIAPAGGAPWGTLRGAPTPDYTRLVRLWDIRAGVRPEEDPYIRQRNVGDRMILASSVSTQSDMQILNNAGFTLFQTDSDHLSTEETRPGQWDFRSAETSRQAVDRLGLDWCYFPHEAFPPQWVSDFTQIQCLEHNQSIRAFSPWDPKWPAFIERGYDALAKEFRRGEGEKGKRGDKNAPTPVSALYVGIHGDYGEAGMFMGARVAVPGQKEDWQKRFGNLHDHLGFWCADPVARQDFRAQMLQKYGSVAGVNTAWSKQFHSPEEIVYPSVPNPEPTVENRRAWLDFVAWYQGGVGRAIELNLRAARTRFPDTLLMLPAGFGDEDVRGGNDNSLIPKLAAKYKADVRSTHGRYKSFADNAVSMLGRLGSASRFYGAPFWTEPPGALTPNEEVERIFESVSQGCAGYFDWASNAVNNRDIYYRYGKFLRVEKPVVDVAMFYPAEAQRLRVTQPTAQTFTRACAYLRDVGNFDIVDDRMVRDGCLSGYRILVLWEGLLAEPETLAKIKAWVEEGGVLLAYDFGKVRTFAGDDSWFQDLFGYYKELAPARVTERYTGNTPPQYRISVGRPEQADYLGDNWQDAEKDEDGNTFRWTGDKATIRLPILPDKRYTLIVRANLPQESAGLLHEVFLSAGGRNIKLGDMSAAGDVTYRYPIPESLLTGRTFATLTFVSQTLPKNKIIPDSADTKPLGIRIQYAQLVEAGTAEDPQALPPPGRLTRELDLRFLNPKYEKPEQSWARLYGKGLTIYFPANKSLLKGYLEVVRQAMYHLSQIDPTRKDDLPIDDSADGVYATLFSDKILYYNPKDTAVTKTLKISASDFAAWKNQVATPNENSWTLKIEPHGIGAIYLNPPPQELLFECEAFTGLGAIKPIVAPDCSPGEGASAVRITSGNAIFTKFKVDVPGRYKLFTRCLRSGKPEALDVLLDGEPVGTKDTEKTRAGQTLFVGTVALTKDSHTLVLKARSGKDVRADFVLLTNEPTIAGYDFATRTVPIE